MKAWQRNQVGSQTVDPSSRGRWAKRTQRRSPKHEHWRQQTVTGDSSRSNSSHVAHLAAAWCFSELESYLSVHSRLASESVETELDLQLHCSSSSEAEPEKVVLRAESPPLASAFALTTSFEEDVLDLKWRQSHHALLCPPTPVLSPLFYCLFGLLLFHCLLHFLVLFLFFVLYLGSPHSSDKMGALGVKTCARACVFVFTSSPSATVHRVFVLPPPPQQIAQRGVEVVQNAVVDIEFCNGLEGNVNGLIPNRQLNVNLSTEARQKSHSQCPLLVARA